MWLRILTSRSMIQFIDRREGVFHWNSKFLMLFQICFKRWSHLQDSSWLGIGLRSGWLWCLGNSTMTLRGDWLRESSTLEGSLEAIPLPMMSQASIWMIIWYLERVFTIMKSRIKGLKSLTRSHLSLTLIIHRCLRWNTISLTKRLFKMTRLRVNMLKLLVSRQELSVSLLTAQKSLKEQWESLKISSSTKSKKCAATSTPSGSFSSNITENTLLINRASTSSCFRSSLLSISCS